MPLNLSPTQVAFNARGDGKFSLPFQEQNDFFRQKLNLPTEYYDDILSAGHDRAFVVAGAAKADLLNDLRTAVDKSIAEGKSIQWFRKEFSAIVQKHGWEGWTGSETKAGRDWRTRVVYSTNIQASYNAGRYAQLSDPELIKNYPYWKYIHNDTVSHPRPLHQSWNGTVLKYDDPWWSAHFTPNGYGCRCRIASAGNDEYKGNPAPDDGTYEKVDRNGVIHILPKGVDYGFDYAPGASVQSQLKDFVDNKAVSLPPQLEQPFKEAMAKKLPYWQAGTEQAAWHDASFIDTPDWIKQSIQKHDVNFGGILSSEKGGAFHRAGYISMGKQDIADYHGQGVWRHEYGHYLDYALSDGHYMYRSSRGDFTSAMDADTKEVVTASGYGRRGKATELLNAARNEKYASIKDEIETLDQAERKAYLSGKAELIGLSLKDIEDFFVKETIHIDDVLHRDIRLGFLIEAIASKDAVAFMDSIFVTGDYGAGNKIYKMGLAGLFSDLVGSATKNKLLGAGPHGWGGHPTGYYKDRAGYGSQTEVFANLTSLLGSNSAFWHKAVEGFYPTLTKLFKEIMK